MVYVGRNLFGDESDTTHYFQDIVSVLTIGLIGEAKKTSDCRVSPFTEGELGSSLVDIDGAVDAITRAAQKYKKLGSPKLKKAEGNWKSQ